jgi:hypothetical protein
LRDNPIRVESDFNEMIRRFGLDTPVEITPALVVLKRAGVTELDSASNPGRTQHKNHTTPNVSLLWRKGDTRT